MKPLGESKIQNFNNDHWLHHTMNTEKSNFISYTYALFFFYFFYTFTNFSAKLIQYAA